LFYDTEGMTYVCDVNIKTVAFFTDVMMTYFNQKEWVSIKNIEENRYNRYEQVRISKRETFFS